MKVKILIAAHKKYDVPKEDCYLPLHVGCEGKNPIGFEGDNTGDNISNKNPQFCELTGIYWAWKNLDCDYLGLVHYRRYFKGTSRFDYTDSKGKKKSAMILGEDDIASLLTDSDIIVPKARNYMIETIYSHYANTLNAKDLDLTREIILEKYPVDVLSFDNVVKAKKAHMFNMFIMKKEMSDEYCKWLFDILYELERRIDISDYTDFQKRLFGRVSEILLNVWIEKNDYKCKEVKVVNLEGEKIIKKAFAFLGAKLFKKKYKKSF